MTAPNRHAALLAYEHATRDLPHQSDAQQIDTLKLALFHALERACDFQDRARIAEARVAALEAVSSERSASGGHERADLQARHDELESICRSLLGTIEQAACDAVSESSAEEEPAVAPASAAHR